MLYQPKNEDDDECFKWSFNVALHYKEIGKDPLWLAKIRLYINEYNWSGIKFPTPSNQWKKFEKQNADNSLKVLFIEDEKKIWQFKI